jgi:hypothetical protein
MSSGVTLPFDILAIIFAHLRPPEVARLRLLNKDICARISAGPYAQKFWHYPRYEIFVEVITNYHLPDSYRQSLAKGYWTIDQLQQVQRICVGGVYIEHARLVEEGFINNPELLSFPFCMNMVFALVEKLCTVEMITCGNPEIMEIIFSSNDVMIELLREGRQDILVYFSEIRIRNLAVDFLKQLFAEQNIDVLKKNICNLVSTKNSGSFITQSGVEWCIYNNEKPNIRMSYIKIIRF